MITYKELKQNKEIQEYYKKGNSILGIMGYTDHSLAHVCLVAEKAGAILKELGYSEREIELAKIAGLMHDIGNAINRKHHAEYGALLANDILKGIDMELKDRIDIVAAIANHDESTGTAIDPVSAALIIADKSDVRRNRVRTKESAKFDIHDRVNYAVIGTNLSINEEKTHITLDLEIDESICSMYDYFEIFLHRMIMCRRASEMLGLKFRLKVNGNKVL